jgi:hypothetical protein
VTATLGSGTTLPVDETEQRDVDETAHADSSGRVDEGLVLFDPVGRLGA